MTTPALMVLGTASHAGKSILTAGLGRVYANAGYRVAPFKAQNMSLNSAATPDGREIGRAQALQAEACRVPACAEMNPVLIKPMSDTGSQVVVLGKVWAQVTASDYHTKRVEQLFPTVIEAYQRLACQYDLMLLEGAGSPAEINLREHDIVNMRMAHAAEAQCLLVGDIDRGGVFASLLGTFELLNEEDRARIRGFVINKFRGDVSLLMPGVRMMEDRLQRPCAGVVPYLHSMGLDEEDGVALEDRRAVTRHWLRGHDDRSVDRPLRIGVIAFPHMANFTDFDALASEPSASLCFIDRAEDIALADVLILPGSKQTLEDLVWMERMGIAAAVRQNHDGRHPIVGICGGFQMLGMNIDDPSGVESGGQPLHRAGLGLLAVDTLLLNEKVTRQARGRVVTPLLNEAAVPDAAFSGYEIHMGETRLRPGAEPFAEITRQGDARTQTDGAVDASGLVMGTYIHGLFDSDPFRHQWLNAARRVCGLAPARVVLDLTAERDRRLDRLADHLEASLDLKLISSWLRLPAPLEPVAIR